MNIKEHFPQFPIDPISTSLTFRHQAYQSTVGAIDKKIQERVQNYECKLLQEQRLQADRLPSKKETYEKWGVYCGEKIGQVVGLAIGILLVPFTSESTSTDQIKSISMAALSSYCSYQTGKIVGALCGKKLFSKFAEIETFDPKVWQHQVCVTEINSLTEASYEILQLITILENQKKEDSDQSHLKEIHKRLEERISLIKNLIKLFYTNNPNDLSDEDDYYLSTRGIPLKEALFETTWPINSPVGFEPSTSLFRALTEKKVFFYAMAKKGSLTFLITTLFEKSLQGSRPEVALAGIIGSLALLHLNEVKEIKEDFIHTSSVCKIVIIAYPILFVSNPLFLLKYYGGTLAFSTIGKLTLAAMAGLSHQVQKNKREVDAYFLKGNKRFLKTLFKSNRTRGNYDSYIWGIKKEGKKLADLKQRLADLKKIKAELSTRLIEWPKNEIEQTK